tara:strand:- start:26157 stop:27557 length:1401 start_codon:yes stop_codon:yes gene_type:complete
MIGFNIFKEVSTMKLQRFITVAFMAVFAFVLFGENKANAAGTYRISCKNNAYGMQLGSDYTQIAYVYNAAATGTTTGKDADTYLIGPNFGEAYVGNDCLYAGAADTNGTAVVAGDVARMAVNAIVGAVSNRIDMAYAAQSNSASATGLSFSNQADGIAMSANGLVAGISFWGDYGSTDVKNTQDFSSVRLDSNRYDGDSSAYSVGVDKTFGKALIGIVVSGINTDLTTTFNDGTYKQDIDTYGIYAAYRTSMLQIDLGMGQGESDIDTTRRDLGNDSTITGKTTADVDYSHARVVANFSRGKFSISPRVAYRIMEMDIVAFTDDRPDENASLITGDQYLFTSSSLEVASGAYGVSVTDDTVAARSVEHETMEIGLKVAANFGALVPYLDLSYNAEDTTAAAYKSEAGTDGGALDLAASDGDNSYTIGGGMNFMIGNHLSGGVRFGNTNGRDDYEESYMFGNLNLSF